MIRRIIKKILITLPGTKQLYWRFYNIYSRLDALEQDRILKDDRVNECCKTEKNDVYHKFHPNCSSKKKVSIICWDMAHNCVGRAYALGQILVNDYDVEIVGPIVSSMGKEIWEPLKNDTCIEYKSAIIDEFPEALRILFDLAKRVDGDIIYISKPRISALLIGLFAYMLQKRPIILDIDDLELSFANHSDILPEKEIEMCKQNAVDIMNPKSDFWIRYCERMTEWVHNITVSNIALQNRYGGTIIPHARNEHLFCPNEQIRDKMREQLGYATDDIVITFIGTPRRHKGVICLARTVCDMPKNVKLCIVGDKFDQGDRTEIESLVGEKVQILPSCPFSDLHEYLNIADIYVILQDEINMTSKFQMPAKFTDAISMGIPIIGTKTIPLQKYVEEGYIIEANSVNLRDVLQMVISDYSKYKDRAEKNRELFLAEFSHAAARKLLNDVIEKSGNEKESDLLDRCKELTNLLVEQFNVDLPIYTVTKNTQKFDVVFLWKQNDSGLYGRRSDMMLKYLAQHDRVDNVIMFNAPIDVDVVERDACNADQLSHKRNTAIRAITGYKEGLEIYGVPVYTYIYRKATDSRRDYYSLDQYADYVNIRLKKHHIGQKNRVIVWNYPINYYYQDFVKMIKPWLLISDVVDDQRMWASSEDSYAQMTRNYYSAVTSSDLIITNCDEMRGRILELVPGVERKCITVANGCESFDNNDYSVPERIASLVGPVIGQVGNLEKKVDIELLKLCAQRHPEWNIVLIGSTHTNKSICDEFNYPNIHLLGPIEYEEVKKYIRHFDVAIMANSSTEFNSAMNPLKLFVYCALGVPVVTTKVPNIEEMGQLVDIAESYDDFISMIENRIKNGKVYSEEDKNIIHKNSWENRVETILSYISQMD